MATPEGGEAIVETALDAFGRVDIVINNAGILRDKTFHNMTPELLDPVIDVHLKGAFYVTRPAWVKMREQGYGRSGQHASNAGILGNFGQTNYGAAKMGLVGLHPGARPGGRQVQHQGQRHRPDRPHPHDRGAARARWPTSSTPSWSRPIVAWLVHEDCPVTGEIYSAGGGRIARFFIGLTEGYYNPELTLEDVRDNFDEIRDENGYIVPTGTTDEISSLVERLR